MRCNNDDVYPVSVIIITHLDMMMVMSFSWFGWWRNTVHVPVPPQGAGSDRSILVTFGETKTAQ